VPNGRLRPLQRSRFSPYGTAFLTDSIIVMRYIEVRSQLQRMVAVVKVRASNHANDCVCSRSMTRGLVRELGEAHEGSVTASSAGKDFGWTFLVTLPMSGTVAQQVRV
jgi:hypothetical protein